MINQWLVAAAFAAGTLLSGGGVRAWYEIYAMPRAVAAADASATSRERQLCLIRTADAAAAARSQEAERQRAAGDAALEIFQRQAAARQRLALSELERQEQEIAEYERILSETGRSCPLDDDTARWLQSSPN